MPEPIPACFLGGAAVNPPASTATGPTLTTSFFPTPLGLASLTWSRTLLGLLLKANLHFPLTDHQTHNNQTSSPLFQIRPWFFWKRKGSRRFLLPNHRSLDVSWDLSRAIFPSTGGPEPRSNFFLSLSLDRDPILLIGDMEEKARRKTNARKRSPPPSIPISKREHVLLRPDANSGCRRSYRTSARVSGKEIEIGIEIGGRDRESSGMGVSVEGIRVLDVKRLRWKFRGRERVEIEGIGRVQISWDLYGWLFSAGEGIASVAGAVAAGEIGEAVFFFRFEREEKGIEAGELMGDWSESNGGIEERKNVKKKKSLLKTSSSSSSSSLSSGGSFSVIDWASSEEVELRGGDGFTLVVYAWKG